MKASMGHLGKGGAVAKQLGMIAGEAKESQPSHCIETTGPYILRRSSGSWDA